MNSGLASHLLRDFHSHQRQHGRGDVGKFAAIDRFNRFVTDVDQRNRQVGVGGMRLTGGRVAHLLGVTVVGGDQQLTANGFHRLSHLVDAAIQRFNRFYGCFHHPGMANHIAVRVVTDDGVVFSAFDGATSFSVSSAELISGCRS